MNMGYAEDFISEGLKAGHSIDDLIANMNQSDDEEEKAFASRWLSTASKPEYAPGATERKTISGSITPMLNVINENPEAAAAVAGAAVAGTAARRYMKGREQSQMAREKHQMDLRRLSLEEQRAADYARQVAAQEKSLITPDIQNQAAALSPAAQEAAPKPSVIPGQQPDFTGPAVPPSGAAPQPVDPELAHRQRMWDEEYKRSQEQTRNIQLKNQKLETPAKTVASGKQPYSEQEHGLVQKGGATSTANKLASSVVSVPDPIVATATPEEKISAVETVSKETQKSIEGKTGAAVKPEMSAAGKTAMEKFGAQYPDIAAQLEKEGKVGLLGFGSGDISLYNTYGAEGRKAVLEHFNKGQPLGPYDPNYENLMSQVRKGVPASEVPGLMAQLPSEAEAGNYGKAEFGKPATVNPKGKLIQGKDQVNKLLKAGGPAVLMMALADIAKAETSKGRKEAIGNALLGLLPLGMDVGEASAPGVSMTPDVYKLGSPYAQSEEAKRHRQAEKVGAGRGIAPPSAYQR